MMRNQNPQLPTVPLTASAPQTRPVIPARNDGRVNSTGVYDDGRGYARIATADQLTSTQLQRLTNQANGYIKNARLRGEEYAAQRGGLGGSIAAGAAERAAIEAALPIAQDNARAEMAAASETLQSLANQRAVDTRTQAQIQAANIGAGAQIRSTEISANSALARARLNNQARKELAQMEFQNRKELQVLGQDFQREMQNLQFDWQAAQNEQNRAIELRRIEENSRQFNEQIRFKYGELAAGLTSGATNTYIAGLVEVLSDPNLSPQQQQAAVSQLQSIFNTQYAFMAPMFGYLQDSSWPPEV